MPKPLILSFSLKMLLTTAIQTIMPLKEQLKLLVKKLTNKQLKDSIT